MSSLSLNSKLPEMLTLMVEYQNVFVVLVVVLKRKTLILNLVNVI